MFADEAQRQQCARWTQAQEARLRKRKPEELVRIEFLNTVCYEAKRAGVEPSLVLGLIQVESGFRKHAISHAGARGYMQIMPFWSRTIGNGDPSSLFHMQTNIRFGCVVLRHYLDREKGNLFMALGRYNGSRGRAEYPNMVTAAARVWRVRRPRPLGWPRVRLACRRSATPGLERGSQAAPLVAARARSAAGPAHVPPSR